MREMPRFGMPDVGLLLLILAAAAGVRVGYLTLCADNARTPGPVQVQGDRSPEEKRLVTHLAENWSFSTRAPFAAADEETAHASPGYPWLLSLLARLPLDPDSTARWAQCGLGALTAGLYFLFARRAFRSRLVGGLAGLLCALHPFWVINTAELNDGVLAGFVLAAALFLGTRTSQAGGSLTSLAYGLTLAAAALVRAAWLPFAFVALLWFLLRCRKQPRGWFLALLAFLGFANGLAPWALRNYQVLGDVVPIVDSTHYHLWMGNNPRATGGPLAEQPLVDALAQQRGQTPEAVASDLEQLKQKERYRSLGTPIVDEVRRNPLGTVQRRLWAGLYFFFGETWFKEQKLWRVTEAPPPPADADEPAPSVPSWFTQSYPVALTGTLLGLLLLGVLGWRWTYAWRVESMPAALAVILIPLPYLLSHAEALQGPRLPLDGILLCYAAFVVLCLVPGVGRQLLAGPQEAD
jgi:4-amino-4-deoxy-L-arabinose transferase-like glycosyltransferase